MTGVRAFLDRPVLLRRAALASIVANVGIVITGGVVRLTGSGLGCPSWPRCDERSLVTTPALGYHGLIEFGNRTLISVVGGLALACALLALLRRERDRTQLTWAGLVLAGIAGQAVLGGITVHTVLNPWIVSAHFLLSMALIAAAYRFWLTTRTPAPAIVAPRPVRLLAWLVAGTSVAVLAVGTVVTGSGPHAGDAHARRTGFDPATVAQLHADLVMLLIGLSVALLLTAPPGLKRAAGVLVGVELAQGLVGVVQYLTHLQTVLVGLHMAGACGVWLATLGLFARRPEPAAAVESAGASESAGTRDSAAPGQERSAPSRATIASASRSGASGA
jgi:cytochrome c oxidase assembly protein subunit 15